MNIKVCGITQLKQLQQLDGLEIDFAGLDFHPASPRYAANGLKGSEVKNADFDLKKTGVFVDMDYDFIMRLVEEYGLDVVQLNGKESPELCEDLSDEVEVIKSFHISPATTNVDELIADYDEVCDYFLLRQPAGERCFNQDQTGLRLHRQSQDRKTLFPGRGHQPGRYSPTQGPAPPRPLRGGPQ
ncbi:MAG: hypothetical protein IPP31_10385 [Chitinophagaceae bacterium]|nr:hypothetical protein [Chitinophagaceae bacterium]